MRPRARVSADVARPCCFSFAARPRRNTPLSSATYCVTCHNDRLKTAGLSLQTLELANVPAHAQVWEKVVRKLRSGEMPPPTVRSRPDPRARRSAGDLSRNHAGPRGALADPNPGRAPVHRLNRAEYSNAIRDLLAVDVRPGEWLPVDDSGYGFDNIAAVLSTSPALLDRYMSAARKVSRLAVGDLTTEAGRRDLQRETRSRQGQPERAVERRFAVRLPRRHDGRALFPARRRIRLQDSVSGCSSGGEEERRSIRTRYASR